MEQQQGGGLRQRLVLARQRLGQRLDLLALGTLFAALGVGGLGFVGALAGAAPGGDLLGKQPLASTGRAQIPFVEGRRLHHRRERLGAAQDADRTGRGGHPPRRVTGLTAPTVEGVTGNPVLVRQRGHADGIGGKHLGQDAGFPFVRVSLQESSPRCRSQRGARPQDCHAPILTHLLPKGGDFYPDTGGGRLVSAGRASGQTPTWQLSLGWDAQRRTLAAQEAVRSGRLTAQQVRAHLPARPAAGIPALIAGLMTNPSNVVALPLEADAVTRQRLRALREAIAGRSVPADATATPGALEAAAERARFAQRQRQALDAVEALAAQKATPESA